MFSPKDWVKLRNLIKYPNIKIGEENKRAAVSVGSKKFETMIQKHLNDSNTN